MTSLRELRLNNWVYSLQVGEYVQISSIDSECVTLKDHVTWGYVYTDMIEPIPLTEEILLKCGFTPLSDNVFIHKELRYSDEFKIREDRYIAFVSGEVYITKIKYLHQLQNLYFALTNQELKIEL